MEENKDINPFDELTGLVDMDEVVGKAVISEGEKQYRYLIYRVFSTDEGRKLLEIWSENLKMSPTAMSGMDQITIGINEGMKKFIRDIILNNKMVEKGEI